MSATMFGANASSISISSYHNPSIVLSFASPFKTDHVLTFPGLAEPMEALCFPFFPGIAEFSIEFSFGALLDIVLNVPGDNLRKHQGIARSSF